VYTEQYHTPVNPPLSVFICIHFLVKMPFIKRLRWLSWFLPIVILSAVTLIDPANLRSPVIFNDDWCIIARAVTGSLQIVNWSVRRPFQDLVFVLVMNAASIKIQYLIWLNLLASAASGVVLYFTVCRAFPKFTWLALPVALVYLAYPVDYTRTWLSMAGIRLSVLLVLGVLYLFVDYLMRGGAWKLVAALIGMILSLGFYDGPIGLFMGAAFLILVFIKQAPARRKRIFFTVLSMAVLYLVWRFLILRYVLNFNDVYYQQIDFSPLVLLVRFYLTLLLFTVDWAAPLAYYAGLSKVLLVLGVVLFSIGSAFLARRLVSAHDRDETGEFDRLQKRALFKSLAVFFLIGVFMWPAGYIPAISVMTPTWFGVLSRANLFSIVGASLTLVSLTSILVLLAAKSLAQVRAMTLAALLPFLLVGVVAQFWMHQEENAAWSEQRSLWNGVLNVLPGLKANTTLVIVIPGENHLRPLQRLPLTAQWEANCALQVVYNDYTLQGRFYYPDVNIQQPVLLETGLKEWDTGALVPYADTVFVSFDPKTQSVRLIQQLTGSLALPFQVNQYAPQARLIAQPAQADLYRWLIK
jgi:hypothetical protein